MTREWRSVVGYEGRYEVSNDGAVRSVWGSVPRPVRPFARKGYSLASLNLKGDRTTRRVQRRVHCLMLEAFVGPCPDGMQTRHLNGNGLDNRLVNLRWGTPSENSHDKVRHGTHPKAARTTCPRRHPLAGPNLDPFEASRGRRSCWACKIAKDAVRARGSGEFTSRADQVYADLVAGWRPRPEPLRTHCPRNHLLSAPNLMPSVARAGKRSCLACNRARGYARRAHERKGIQLDVTALADAYFAELMATT